METERNRNKTPHNSSCFYDAQEITYREKNAPWKGLCLKYLLTKTMALWSIVIKPKSSIYLVNTQLGACSALHTLMLLLVVVISDENC